MWTLFKIINFLWLLTSTYAWFTTSLPLTPMIALVNIGMIICINFLPIEIKFGQPMGRVILAIIALTIWSIWIDGFMNGIYTLLIFFPVLILILLPTDYKKDLLNSVTKWYAILLGLGLMLYFLTLFIPLPSFGRYTHPVYAPFDNYIFYIKTTWDNGIFTRFNAFFLEPGHQALVSTFLLMANSFHFKKNKYLIILLIGVIFSFSLAGYLLLTTGWLLLSIKNFKRSIPVVILLSGVAALAVGENLGNNAFKELIINRLEYDQEKGIKGNNRFTEGTEFLYQQSKKKDLSLIGMKGHTDTDNIAGAGYKIYVIRLGWIGVILAALFYLCVIPPGFNKHYTAVYLIVLTLCFTQRSYPGWYSWLLPYVLGIYINRKSNTDDPVSNNTDISLMETDKKI